MRNVWLSGTSVVQFDSKKEINKNIPEIKRGNFRENCALEKKKKKIRSCTGGRTVQIKCVHPSHTSPLPSSRSDSVQGAGLAGGRAGREAGPHPRELRGDAVAVAAAVTAAATATADDGNIY